MSERFGSLRVWEGALANGAEANDENQGLGFSGC